MKINHHKLVDARQTPSPNFTERAQGEEISLLVIHNISLPPGEYGGNYIDDLFCNCLDYSAHPYFKDLKDLRVSSHLLINRQGQVTQYVPFDMKAHHAGESSFQGRERCNDFSIGIELEGCDEEPFTDSQYATLAEITGLLMHIIRVFRRTGLPGTLILRQPERQIPVPVLTGGGIWKW